MTQTERIENICVKTAAWFAKRYGGDPADLLQDAQLAALEAIRCYDPTARRHGSKSGTTIETWINRYVWRRLMDSQKDKARHGRIAQVLSWGDKAPYFEKREPAPRRFDLRDFCTEISEDARTVVKILFETPEFVRAAGSIGGRPAGKPTLRRILAGRGWAENRVADCFAEIEGALV